MLAWAPRRVAERLATRVAIVLIAGLAVPLGCRSPRTRLPTPQYLGDFRGAPTSVDPAFAADWTAMREAIAADPAQTSVVEAADRLLAAGPPLELRLWGVHAKAQHAYLHGDDTGAIAMVDQVLAAVKDPAPVLDAISALSLVRVRALVRTGDPGRALVVLDDPALARPGVLGDEERAGIRALALDRNGRQGEALVAFATWRAQLVDEGAAAAYAEARLGVLATALGRAAIAEVAGRERGDVRACLDALTGVALPDGAPAWTERCTAAPLRVGILLPRTGPLAALAPQQLAAVGQAVALLQQAEAPGLTDVIWQDAGAEPQTAADGAARLVAAGATAIVGPIGPANVKAAAARIGASARLWTPGEPVGDVPGSAPTLEARVAALVDVALERRAERLIVLVPDSGYGKRAAAAAKKRSSATRLGTPQVVTYPVDTTSFAPILDPLGSAIGARTAVLVGDATARTELVVRQLARDGKGPGKDDAGPHVLATAEGISEAEAGVGHDVLAGMWIAPASSVSPEVSAFADAYTRAEGQPPSDHALLVFRALRSAATGAKAQPAAVQIVRVLGGRLVVQSPRSN